MLPYSTNKFRDVILRIKRSKNCHRIWDHKQRLIVVNPKISYEEWNKKGQ